MKQIKYRLVFALGIIFLLEGCVVGDRLVRKNLPGTIKGGDIIHSASGKKVPPGVLDKFLELPDILYVGESHENSEAHRVQLELLRAFYSKYGSDVVIGMEMFKRPHQAALDNWIGGESDEKGLLKKTHWQKEWGFDFRLYAQLWNFARDNKIPLIALNASRDQVKEISSKGLDGLSPEQKNQLPEIDRSDPYHRLYLEKIFSLHNQDKDRFEKFYQVQCFWEDFMARSISEYLLSPAGAGKKMIVFIGNGHIIYDFGVPKRVFGRTHLPYLTVYTYDLPDAKDGPDYFDPVLSADIPLEPADFLMAVQTKKIKSKHGVLGVSLDVTPEKKVLIKKVHDGSPGAKAGLKDGDIITGLDGEVVSEVFDVTYALKYKKDDDTCLFSILRDDAPMDITVKLFSWKFHHKF